MDNSLSNFYFKSFLLIIFLHTFAAPLKVNSGDNVEHIKNLKNGN